MVSCVPPGATGMPDMGKTYEAAVRYAEEALSGYLETLAKHGDPIPVLRYRCARVFGGHSSDGRHRLVCSRVYLAPGRGKLSKRWSERADHQQGSHAFYRHPQTRRTTVVPVHSKELPRWLLKRIIKFANCCEAPSPLNSRHIPW
jgi:hypothetical protein